jgi:hypothetical protein
MPKSGAAAASSAPASRHSGAIFAAALGVGDRSGGLLQCNDHRFADGSRLGRRHARRLSANAIGSGASTLDEATVTVSSGSFATVTLFSGLNPLARTDYYLTIAPETGSNAQWAVHATLNSTNFTFSQPPMVLDSGVGFLSPPVFLRMTAAAAAIPRPPPASKMPVSYRSSRWRPIRRRFRSLLPE